MSNGAVLVLIISEQISKLTLRRRPCVPPQAVPKHGLVLQWLKVFVPSSDANCITRHFEGNGKTGTFIWSIYHVNKPDSLFDHYVFCTQNQHKKELGLVISILFIQKINKPFIIAQLPERIFVPVECVALVFMYSQSNCQIGISLNWQMLRKVNTSILTERSLHQLFIY